MAGVRFTVSAEGVAHSTSTLTMLTLVAAANRRVKIERIVISGKGILNTDAPVTFEVLEAASTGTSSTSVTPVKSYDADPESIGTTAKTGFTVEPTYSAGIKDSRAIHPQTSQEIIFPPLRELYVQGGNTLNIRVNTPAQAETWNITVYCEE